MQSKLEYHVTSVTFVTEAYFLQYIFHQVSNNLYFVHAELSFYKLMFLSFLGFSILEIESSASFQAEPLRVNIAYLIQDDDIKVF